MIEPGLMVTTELEVESPALKSEGAPYKIAFVADLHVGAPHAGLDRMEDLVAEINGHEPDLVLLGGDFVIHGVPFGDFVAPDATAAVLAGLQARDGVVAVLGNHDWWYNGADVRQALERVGITVLENQTLAVATESNTLWIAGLADDTTRWPDLPKTLAQVTGPGPVIVLAHDPASFATVPFEPVITLAGHTHGGQVYLPFIGAPIVPGRAPRRYAYGLIQEAGRALYVTSGIGTSILPIRFNMPPEIVVLTLGPIRAN